MRQTANHKENPVRRGIIYALGASIMGSIALAITPLLHFLVTSQGPNSARIALEVEVATIMTIYSIILVIIPSAIGGAILASLLKNDFHNDRLSSLRATVKGAVAGVASVSVVILFVGILMEMMIWSRGRGSIQGFLFFSSEALLIATIAGGLVGNRLAAYLLRN